MGAKPPTAIESIDGVRFVFYGMADDVRFVFYAMADAKIGVARLDHRPASAD